ncbi:SUKH-3 domain-containing protein [Aquisphaera giovannonii]
MADPILREFAGLRVGRSGPGRDRAASDIEFHTRPSFDHRYAVAELEPAGADLFPLGNVHNRHMELFIGPEGRVFAYLVPVVSCDAWGTRSPRPSSDYSSGLPETPNVALQRTYTVAANSRRSELVAVVWACSTQSAGPSGDQGRSLVSKVSKTLDRVLRGAADSNIRFDDLRALLTHLGVS